MNAPAVVRTLVRETVRKHKWRALQDEREATLEDYLSTYYEPHTVPERVELPCHCVSLRVTHHDESGKWSERKWIESCAEHGEEI